MGSAWPSFRRHRGTGSACRANPRRAVRLSAGNAVDHRRGVSCRLRSGLRNPLLLNAPRREDARADGEGRGGEARRFHRPRGCPHHHDHFAFRRGPRGREGPGRIALGHLHPRDDGSGGDVHGRVSALSPPRQGDGSDRDRPRPHGLLRHLRTVGRALPHVGTLLHPRPRDPRSLRDRLRLRGLGPAGVAAAGPA